ncbi:DUF2285 domain-containing protein [Xaviernesmea oryzae]|uniref:DUF2285 domain-containing protein n=1 Tax=Xaviernesmea oryzae TaxID=464029 RepID=UPI001F1D6326|nr:DUF2285 domain-containing protein [Xaviernesmea oryzae]
MTLTDIRDGSEGRFARHRAGQSEIPLLLLPGAASELPLAALVPLGADARDRVDAIFRFQKALQGLPAPDTRLTELRRWRIPRELRAADARAHGATYREIAEALHGPRRVAEEPDWDSSPLRTEAIELVARGRALIAGSYRKLFRHRRRP